jgi:hypothetical protein
MLLILVLAVVVAGGALFLMSGRKRDTLTHTESPPVMDTPPPHPLPVQAPELDPAEEHARTAALQDTREPAVPSVSTPRLTALHIIDNVHRFHFVATLGRRLVFVFHPYGHGGPGGFEHVLDADGSNTGPLFDHLAECAIAAGLPELPSRHAREAFQPHTVRTPSVHIRALFEDGRSWADMYDAEEVARQGLPAGLLGLLLDMRSLGFQFAPDTIKSQAGRPPLLHFSLLDKASDAASEYRILVSVKETTIISLPPEGAEKGATYLIPFSEHRELLEPLAARLDALIDLHRIFALTPFQGERSLRNETLEEAAFLARIAIGDGQQYWATVLDPADVAGRGLPPVLAAFSRDVRTLTVPVARASMEKQKATA